MDYYQYDDEDIGPWCSDNYRPRHQSHATVPIQKDKSEGKETNNTMHTIVSGKRSILPRLKMHYLSPGQPIKQQYINQYIMIKESPKDKHYLPQLSLIKMKPHKQKQKNTSSDIHVIFEIEKIIRRNYNYRPNQKFATSTIL